VAYIAGPVGCHDIAHLEEKGSIFPATGVAAQQNQRPWRDSATEDVIKFLQGIRALCIHRTLYLSKRLARQTKRPRGAVLSSGLSVFLPVSSRRYTTGSARAHEVGWQTYLVCALGISLLLRRRSAAADKFVPSRPVLFHPRTLGAATRLDPGRYLP